MKRKSGENPNSQLVREQAVNAYREREVMSEAVFMGTVISAAEFKAKFGRMQGPVFLPRFSAFRSR